MTDADVNIRDFSGRKPRHYLKTGSSTYMQRKTDPFSNYPSSSYSNPSSYGIGYSCSASTAASYSTEDTPGNSFTRAMGRLSFRRPNAVKRSKSEKYSTPVAKSNPLRSPSMKRPNSKHPTEIVRIWSNFSYYFFINSTENTCSLSKCTPLNYETIECTPIRLLAYDERF